MSKTIVFIHGAWLTPAAWDGWRSRFADAGYDTLAPAWPFLDEPVEALRAAPDPRLGKLTLAAIADHFAAIVSRQPEPPMLVGHSYGGLIVQMLLARGLGAAGVSISPGPAAGIKPGGKAFLSALPVFLAWRGWSRALTMTFRQFRRNFANRMPEGEARAAYARHVVPAPGRIYYQSVLGIGSGLDWKRPDRAPLLLMGGEDDRIVEPGMVRQNLARYQASPARTDLRTWPGRDHFLIATQGWEEVADAVCVWIEEASSKSP